jgi:hypothetical protein
MSDGGGSTKAAASATRACVSPWSHGGMTLRGRTSRARSRALTVGRVAHQSGLRAFSARSACPEREATRESAEAFRCGLEELGTTFIKLGQLLSSRPDLLPDVYIEELGRLVDDVPAVVPLLGDRGRRCGRTSARRRFASIDPEPLATASIAQTHRGCWPPGTTSCSRCDARRRRAGRSRPRAAALDGAAGGRPFEAARRVPARGARRRARDSPPRRARLPRGGPQHGAGAEARRAVRRARRASGDPAVRSERALVLE